MNGEELKTIEGVIKETCDKVRFDRLKAGAMGISGAVLEICNEQLTDKKKVQKIRNFCEIGLGLKKG